MRIQTYSVIVGNKACNARCPYCISRMTPSNGLGGVEEINWRNFEIGCKFAKDSGVSTVLFTGKGEPTLFPNQITDFLEHLHPFNFPFIELQTNGMLLVQKKGEYAKHLKRWYKLGLTTVAVSVVHYDNYKNRNIFQPKGPYMNLTDLISHLHSFGFSARLSATMFKGGIDNFTELKKLIFFARENGVEQLTARPVAEPDDSENEAAAKWVKNHKLTESALRDIRVSLEKRGRELMRFVHGAVVYDFKGQNICLTNCLTKPVTSASSEEIRQLIFFPDGHLRYDWQHKGAILL